ncbi:restriction endonuclease subunit S [Lactobacillus delbrueckii]|nr:restriction endonuclease subunit S [Lactobacillus delbrueckii]MCD5458859.1 restriction endonuclease subunit S [Lactobacillus delbrueckii subsp. bulgaricus]MCD9226665.1 restriction endonuclease subunit S [Lactobacillus delbrueckii subsp. bulgaricus]
MGVSTPALPSVEYDDINPGMGTLNKDPKSKGTSKRGIHFNPGDVLFGKLRPYLKNWLFACFEGVAVGDFWVLTSSKIDHGFIYSLIQAPGFQYIANLSSGSKMPRSDWGLVSNARTFIPTNLSEQESISSVLFGLDTTITLHEEKKRQLERLKSALLQKMFADKSGYPPVRFEGFSDKWEQVKYGEIFQRRSKMGVSTPTLPSVEYDDINPGMGTLNKEPKSKGISKRGIYFNPGDVLFGKLRPYLKNWLFACFEGVAVGDFWVLTSSKIDHGFTYSLIQTPGFQYIANLSSGSKMPRSDWGLVSNARTFIPINHLEQERISSVLFGLDHAITLYEHKLEILNKIKSFLLQNMFI